jgi:hypothetical protein
VFAIYRWTSRRAKLQRQRYSLGFLTSTLGTVTSFFSVFTVGTLIVSLTVPVSTLGVLTVSVSLPTTGFWTSDCASPVYLHPLRVQTAANATASVSFRTTDLPFEGPTAFLV